MFQDNLKTRLISIESQPKKVVIVVVVVDVVVVCCVAVVGVVFVFVGHKNLTLKFGQNWVNNKSYDVVVVIVGHRNLTFKSIISHILLLLSLFQFYCCC